MYYQNTVNSDTFCIIIQTKIQCVKYEISDPFKIPFLNIITKCFKCPSITHKDDHFATTKKLH